MDTNSIIIKGSLTAGNLYDAVAKVTGVSRSMLLSDYRIWPAVEARMLAALVLNRMGIVDAKIAWLLNRRRASVCKSRHTGEDQLKVSKTFQDKYQKLQTILNPQKDEK